MPLPVEASSAGPPRDSRIVCLPDALRHKALEVITDDVAAFQDRLQPLLHLLTQIRWQHCPCSCQLLLEDPAALARER